MMSLWAGYLFLAINAAALIFIGYMARIRQVHGASDFMVAGRRVRWPLVSGSIVVTWAWASTVLASGEATYNFGWSAIWIYPISGISMLLCIPLFSRIKEALPQGLTFPEFVRLRFGKQVHLATTVITVYILFMLLFYLLIGIGWALNPIFGIPYWQGVLIGGAIVIVYTTLGGLWSSIITDYFQYFILWVVIMLVIFFSMGKVGGFGQLYNDLMAMGVTKGYTALTADAFVNYFLIIIFAWITYAIMDQTIWQRVYALEKPREVKKTLFTAWITWSLVPMAAGLIGLIGLQQGLELTTASNVIPKVVSMLVPAWLGVLFAVMVFNAIASTMGSMLVAISSIVTVDIYEAYFSKGKELPDTKRFRLTWILVVVIGALAIVLSLKPTSIMFLGFYLSGLLLSVTLPIAIGLIKSKSNLQSIRVAMIIGFAIALVLSAGVNYGWLTHIGSLSLKLWEVYAFILVLQVLIVYIASLLKPGPEMTIADVGKMAQEGAASA